jgi:hypothetical protein
MLLSYTIRTILVLSRVSWYKFSSIFVPGGRGCGWRGQVINEEVSYHKCDVQDVTIEDLQRQVAELTQRLAAQNMEINCNIDGRNSESNFENQYYNPILFREQLDWDKRHRDLGFRVKLPKFFDTLTTLTIVSKCQAHLPNPSYVEKDDKFIYQNQQLQSP